MEVEECIRLYKKKKVINFIKRFTPIEEDNVTRVKVTASL
jgi:penicillin-binding protein-related factor A (putative recombinase)